jgi:hypothetical protein
LRLACVVIDVSVVTRRLRPSADAGVLWTA